MQDEIEIWLKRVGSASKEVDRILSDYGRPSPRLNYLQELQEELVKAPVDVQLYFLESISCLKVGVIRPAIVSTWSGFISIFCEKFLVEKGDIISQKYNAWSTESSSHLLDSAIEHQILDVAEKINFISKSDKKRYIGWHSQRNECAHPSIFRPSLNIGIGFVESMILESKKFL